MDVSYLDPRTVVATWQPSSPSHSAKAAPLDMDVLPLIDSRGPKSTSGSSSLVKIYDCRKMNTSIEGVLDELVQKTTAASVIVVFGLNKG